MREIDLKSFFGRTVRETRLGLGMSQEELAERAGLHRTYISDVERGARNLSLESIDKLATALEISISALFATAANGGTGKDKPPAGPIPDKLVNILLIEDDSHDLKL